MVMGSAISASEKVRTAPGSDARPRRPEADRKTIEWEIVLMTAKGYDDDVAVRGEGNTLGVADAKASLSELIERVARGERFLILRRGRPALALVPPEEAAVPRRRPSGLATIAGALEDWGELPAVVEDIYRTRRRSQDRPAPHLG